MTSFPITFQGESSFCFVFKMDCTVMLMIYITHKKHIHISVFVFDFDSWTLAATSLCNIKHAITCRPKQALMHHSIYSSYHYHFNPSKLYFFRQNYTQFLSPDHRYRTESLEYYVYSIALLHTAPSTHAYYYVSLSSHMRNNTTNSTVRWNCTDYSSAVHLVLKITLSHQILLLHYH